MLQIPPKLMLGSFNVSLHLSRFLSPLSAVPLVALSGFGLYEFGFPVVCNYVFSTTKNVITTSSLYSSSPPTPPFYPPLLSH
jgi:hypothetical protein